MEPLVAKQRIAYAISINVLRVAGLLFGHRKY